MDSKTESAIRSLWAESANDPKTFEQCIEMIRHLLAEGLASREFTTWVANEVIANYPAPPNKIGRKRLDINLVDYVDNVQKIEGKPGEDAYYLYEGKSYSQKQHERFVTQVNKFRPKKFDLQKAIEKAIKKAIDEKLQSLIGDSPKKPRGRPKKST